MRILVYFVHMECNCDVFTDNGPHFLLPQRALPGAARYVPCA